MNINEDRGAIAKIVIVFVFIYFIRNEIEISYKIDMRLGQLTTSCK